eukprot:CAMPEP_0178954674 /NCGR_PEP_ID=MMETSP0789-20121207/9135_1 /TAXON_ID=3005 /ORGANISM="Rhizosolenia setigera, Strain CCMP 1694" /LENGTH=532 /DNA_ID=CAMNT_0020636129 /DNA_START=207 /DNA_END=1801 /DNA_ORIENTATION=+
MSTAAPKPFGSTGTSVVTGTSSAEKSSSSASSVPKKNPFSGIKLELPETKSNPFTFGSQKSSPTKPTSEKHIFGSKSTPTTASFASLAASSSSKGAFSFGTPKKDEPVPVLEAREDAISYDSSAAKSAVSAFDRLDKEKAKSLPMSMFEDLLEELGEGFHGEELDKQIAIVDPKKSNQINRTSFVKWYCDLVEGECGGSDAGSLDTEEREEREEEAEKARSAFKEISEDGGVSIEPSQFGDLIHSMGTTYCEEEHRRTIRKLTVNDKIFIDPFIDWYIEWLFGDGDDSDQSESSIDRDNKLEETSGNNKSESTGWGECFATESGSWKCDACLVTNKAADITCAACEAVRPGYEDQVKSSSDKTTASSSSIGASGFTFGVPAPSTAAPSTASSKSPFTFGSAPTTSGFSFGSTSTASGSGFSFGVKSTEKKEESKSTAAASPSPFSFGTSSTTFGTSASTSAGTGTGAFTFGKTSASSSNSTSVDTKKAESKADSVSGVSSKSSAFPPMSVTAPKPVSKSSSSAEKKEEPKSS